MTRATWDTIRFPCCNAYPSYTEDTHVEVCSDCEAHRDDCDCEDCEAQRAEDDHNDMIIDMIRHPD